MQRAGGKRYKAKGLESLFSIDAKSIFMMLAVEANFEFALLIIHGP